MRKKTQTQKRVAANMFGDYTFADTWIIVTDQQRRCISVTEDEIIPSNMPVDENNYIKVRYCRQWYWLSKNLHQPM